MSDADVAEIDAFLEEFKELDGYLAPWATTYGRDYCARWAILDALGIQRGELCMTIDAALQKPSIVATCERRMIFRLDLVPPGECEPNHFGAKRLGLKARICGSHIHPWRVNREFVRVYGLGELPYKVEIGPTEITFAQALLIVAEHLNLTVRGDQRDITLPSQAAFRLEGRTQ